MSSDLRELIKSDLDRIPLPASEEWARIRARRRAAGWSAALAVILAIAVVVASLGAGQALRAVRDWADTQRAATGIVSGHDYVYLADGDPTAQFIEIVDMPAGGIRSRLVGQTYTGSSAEGTVGSLSGDIAYLPVANSGGRGLDVFDTYLQEIDLRRGIPLRRIALGPVTFPTGALVQLRPTVARFSAATAMSGDGKYVWLVRDVSERGLTAIVDRFEVQPILSQTADRHAELVSAGAEAIRSSIVALASGAVVVRVHYPADFRSAAYGADWIFLDEQARVLAAYWFREPTDGSGRGRTARLPEDGLCSTDVLEDPASGGWIVLCSDFAGAEDGAVIFFDRNGSISAQVPLRREIGPAAGMTVARDGTVSVVTTRPVVIRIDARTRQVIDARPVTASRSLLERMLPPVAAAKGLGGPSVVFSSDARYAYLVASPDEWWGSLAKIDLATARVVARSTAVRNIGGLGLSEDGQRLYALGIDYDKRERRLALFDPATLRVASQSGPLPNDPHAILAVRTPLPSGP